MKMSDVFELPVCAPVSTDDELVDDFCGYIAEFASRDTAKAAAHAINCHDGLVEVLGMALALIKANAIDNPECTYSHNLAMRACDELHRAKGEL